MNALRILAPIVACLLIALTWLLVQGTAPDAAQHERILGALRTVTLRNAALQRDVLRSRAGLLRNYDPLVRSIEDLRRATASLRAARGVATGEARADIDRKVDEVSAAVRDQEALIEAFKSKNALLQNSLSYFTYLSGRLAAAGGAFPATASAEIGALTTAMLQFMREPRSGAAGEATASLDRLARMSTRLTQDVRSLVAHGRLVVATLPAVDDLVARLQAAPTSAQARALQDIYLEAHGRATARARIYQTLLYIAALVLVAYIAYLFVRLRANARTLRERLAFEDLIASVSARFINLPHDRIRAGVGEGLAQLVRHSSLDSAEIIIGNAAGAGFSGSYAWCRPTGTTDCPPEKVIELASDWSLEGYERQGCIYVPDVRELPDGKEKASLQACGIRTWLCIPMWHAGERLGLLVLVATTAEKRWPDDDIALLRTAAEIFANAIARERTESERETLQARLNQSQRLEAIGTLAGGIAHEFNNILGAILGYSEMALAALRRNPSARRHVGQIVKAGERAQDVVDQVLAFSRHREQHHRPMRAEPVVAEAVDLIRASFPATLSVRAHFDAKEGLMIGDPTGLQQVVMNLCTNAAQAMKGRGVLELRLETVQLDDLRTLSHGSLVPGRYIRLAVQDTGEGIGQATMERIFEPFFTTKPVGQGTGLGLSTVHGIVTDHGGSVNVKSKLGEGTTFEVFFPRVEGTVVHEEEAALEAPVRRGHGEAILIVDDDRPLMLLGEEMLAALGYEPVGFDHGPAALAAFRADPGRFDMVITDEIMPEMTGTELADALRAIRPDLPIVLMTGYDRSIRSDLLHAAGIREVLKKPLRSKALADCVARQLPAIGEVWQDTRGRSEG